MSEDDRRIVERATALYDSAISEIDPKTAARLASARRRAVLQGPAGSPLRWMVPAGVAAAVVAGLIIGLPQAGPDYPELVATDDADDVEILLAEESLEMIEDLEFYLWLDVEPDAG